MGYPTPTPSYDLQLSDERTGLSAKRCPVPSCYSGGGAFLRSVDRLGTCVTESYLE
jgi:hypothetical protein